MKVTVIIEQNSKGRYSAYISDKRIKFGVLGEGKTVEGTIEDFKIGYEEMKETFQIVGNKPFARKRILNREMRADFAGGKKHQPKIEYQCICCVRHLT